MVISSSFSYSFLCLAYVYSDLLDYGGYFTLIISFLINTEVNSINFYSIYGAIFVFIFSLYPYVYLLARQAFIAQSGTYIEVAKVSGLNLDQYFIGFYSISQTGINRRSNIGHDGNFG